MYFAIIFTTELCLLILLIMVIYTVYIIFMIFSVLLRSPVFSFGKSRQSAWQSPQKLQVLSAHTKNIYIKSHVLWRINILLHNEKELQEHRAHKTHRLDTSPSVTSPASDTHADTELLCTASYPCQILKDIIN